MGRRRTIHHDLPPGLHRKRGRYYYGRKMEALGPDLTLALRAWAERKGEEVTEAATFSDAIRHYRIHALHKVAPATRLDYVGRIKRLEEVFGKMHLSTIKPQHIRQFLNKRPGVAGTRDKAVFSLIFNHAREQGFTEVPNPATGIRGTKSKSSVYITDQQLAAVIERSDAELAVFLELCWRTGADASVVLRMSPADFQGEDLLVRRTKTGEATAIRITERLRQLSLALPFRSSLQLIRRRFWAARTASGCSFTIKQLRAKAGTDAGSLAEANALLGHTSEATTAVYRRRITGRSATPIDRPLGT